jgi:hypothetical protein
MSSASGKKSIRATAVLRAAWAGALIVVPERLLGAGAAAPVPAAAVAVARVLGVRHLLQASASALAPTGPVAGLGAAIDTLHAASVVGLSALSPRWRRAALLDAMIETGFAAAGWSSSAPPRRVGRSWGG